MNEAEAMPEDIHIIAIKSQTKYNAQKYFKVFAAFKKKLLAIKNIDLEDDGPTYFAKCKLLLKMN